MKLMSAVLLSAAIAIAPAVWGDVPGPAPGPQWRKLGYFIGTWHATGTMRATQSFPGGKFENVTRNEWMEGGFFYLMRHREHNPTGTHTMVGVTGYDPVKKVYFSYYFGEDGGVSQETGTLEGNTWIWNSEFRTAKGEAIKTRSVDTPVSPRSYKFKWQIRRPGGGWVTLQEGAATKVK